MVGVLVVNHSFSPETNKRFSDATHYLGTTICLQCDHTPSILFWADECASNPCVNGNCDDGDNHYTCNCHGGFEGTNCDINTGTVTKNSSGGLVNEGRSENPIGLFLEGGTKLIHILYIL